MDGIHAGFPGRAARFLHGCSISLFRGKIRLKLLHSCSFSPRIPSNPAKMEEIAAPLQEFLFPDRASTKKLQNCSFGRSSRMAGQAPASARGEMFTRLLHFIFSRARFLHRCSIFPFRGKIRLKLLHSCSFSPQIPSNPAKMEEIAAPLQEFLFPDRASTKKLQKCSFGRSSRMAGQAPASAEREMFTRLLHFIFSRARFLHGCSISLFRGKIRLKLLHSCSFSPRIPSNPAKTKEIAAPLQEFLFPDRASTKKLQNCSIGRSSWMAGQAPASAGREMFTRLLHFIARWSHVSRKQLGYTVGT
ncbi:hypothetical protein DOE73_24735 [Paenibacillus dendritiformis]|nr:hypothetical protein DOE73_24735 [Paenibacillus dendritiformis]